MPHTPEYEARKAENAAVVRLMKTPGVQDEVADALVHDMGAELEVREQIRAIVRDAVLLRGAVPREHLQDLAYGAAIKMFAGLLNGTYEVKTGQQAATIARVAVDIFRIEQGQATSIRDNLTPEQVLEALQELRAKARTGA